MYSQIDPSPKWNYETQATLGMPQLHCIFRWKYFFSIVFSDPTSYLEILNQKQILSCDNFIPHGNISSNSFSEKKIHIQI